MISRGVIYILSFATLLTGCQRPGDGRESSSTKREWSILQSLESKHRNQTIQAPEIITAEEHQIICVPHHTNGTRIWIMAAPESPPFYKQMPTGNYWLTEKQIEYIRNQSNPITTVLQVLESHTQ